MRTWLKPRPGSQEPKRRRGSLVAWVILLIGVAYFVLPLIATLEFSLRPKPTTLAYTNVLADPKFAASLAVLLHDRDHHDLRLARDHPADRLLGPAQGARGCGPSWSS